MTFRHIHSGNVRRSRKLQKNAKILHFKDSSFKVIDLDIPKKIVTSACYDMQHICAYLQPFSWQMSQ